MSGGKAIELDDPINVLKILNNTIYRVRRSECVCDLSQMLCMYHLIMHGKRK